MNDCLKHTQWPNQNHQNGESTTTNVRNPLLFKKLFSKPVKRFLDSIQINFKLQMSGGSIMITSSIAQI